MGPARPSDQGGGDPAEDEEGETGFIDCLDRLTENAPKPRAVLGPGGPKSYCVDAVMFTDSMIVIPGLWRKRSALRAEKVSESVAC